ncbi:MAG: phosphate ABC transporter substrate-binding protein [Actinomycetota bacterium]
MRIIKIIAPLFISLATCFWLQSCSKSPVVTTPSTTPSAAKLTLSGSTTIAVLATELAKHYQAINPGVKIDIQKTSSWRGITDVRQGIADIGMVNRALTNNEQNLSAFTIANDGISMVVHRDNPVQNLTTQQIGEIYTDKINNWQKLGGKNAPIVTVSRAEGRASLDFFIEYLKIGKSAIRSDVVVGDTEESIQAVLDNPNAISFASLSYAEEAAAQGKPIKLLAINGVKASSDNVKKGTFPMTRPLNLVTKSSPAPAIKNFIDFTLSTEGQEVLRQKKVVPVK